MKSSVGDGINDSHDNSTPRILHVFGGLLHGGAEALVMNYYRHIDTSSMQFDFIVHTPVVGVYEAEILSRGGRIFRAPAYTGRNHFQYRAWWKSFLDEHPEHHIVHFHIRGSSAIAIPLAKRAGRVTIIHSHSISNGKSLTAAIKNIFQLSLRRDADYLFACSEAAGRWLFGRKAMESGHVQVWKNAIDLSAYEFSPRVREEYRKEYGEDAFIVGHVGRFVEAKNHRFLLEIFKEIVERKPNALLLLVGDGPLFEQIQERALALGIEQSVRFLGARSDVPQLLQAMDVFLFPSKFEGLGIVAIEAQAAGLACFASTSVPQDIGITDLVQFIGLDVEPKRWATSILESDLRRREEDTREALQKAGYDITQSTEQLCEFYSHLDADHHTLR